MYYWRTKTRTMKTWLIFDFFFLYGCVELDTYMNLSKLNPQVISDGAVVLMLGKRGTGKSTVVRDLLWYKRHIPDGLLLSPTADMTGDYADCIPSTFIIEKWDPEVVQQFLNRQTRINRRRKKAGLPKKYAFLVAEDCGYDAKFVKDPILKEMFMNGRHQGVFFIFTLQYAISIKPELRSQIDWVFILKEDTPKYRKILFEEYCGAVGSRQQFDKVMDVCTEDYRCLVIKRTGSSNKLENSVFWYRAKLRGRFRMGSVSYWATHLKYFNQHYDSDEDDDVAVDSGGGGGVDARGIHWKPTVKLLQ